MSNMLTSLLAQVASAVTSAPTNVKPSIPSARMGSTSIPDGHAPTLGPLVAAPNSLQTPRVRGLSQKSRVLQGNILSYLATCGTQGATQTEIEVKMQLNRSQGYRHIMLLCNEDRVERFETLGGRGRKLVARYRINPGAPLEEVPPCQ